MFSQRLFLQRVIVSLLALVFITGCAGSNSAPEIMFSQPLPAENASPATVPAAKLTPGDFVHPMTVNGMDRYFILHIPPGLDEDTHLPVVIIFHEFTKSMTALRQQTKFDDRSDANGFVAVYPYGIGASWNAGDCCGMAMIDNLDDVEFVRQILIDLSNSLALDPQRIYAAGYGVGGMMAYRLG